MADIKPDRHLEATRLHDWCLTIVELTAQQNDPALRTMTESIIKDLFANNNVRGLRMMAKELSEMAGALEPTQWTRLDDALRSRFGRGLSDVADERRRNVSRILKRGAIRTDDEYRLVQGYVDEIYADDSKREEWTRLGELLNGFDRQRKARR